MFGRRIKKMRNEKGLTQEQLAHKFNLSKETFCHYEKERRKPPIDIISDLADFFDTSIDYMMGRTDKRYGINKDEVSPEMLKMIRELKIKDIEVLNYVKNQGFTAEEIKRYIDALKELRLPSTKKD